MIKQGIGDYPFKYSNTLKRKVSFTDNSKLLPLASMTSMHPVVRKLFAEEMPMHSGRKVISVCKTVGKKYRRPRNFVDIEGVPDTIHKPPSLGEFPKHNKNIRTPIIASARTNIITAGEGSY